MTTTPIQSDVLEILRTLPSESVRLFDLNITVPNPTMPSYHERQHPDDGSWNLSL